MITKHCKRLQITGRIYAYCRVIAAGADPRAIFENTHRCHKVLVIAQCQFLFIASSVEHKTQKVPLVDYAMKHSAKASYPLRSQIFAVLSLEPDTMKSSQLATARTSNECPSSSALNL